MALCRPAVLLCRYLIDRLLTGLPRDRTRQRRPLRAGLGQALGRCRQRLLDAFALQPVVLAALDDLRRLGLRRGQVGDRREGLLAVVLALLEPKAP